MDQRLIDMVLLQIKVDVRNKDLTAIEELIKSIPVENLTSYLCEVIKK